VNSNKDKKVTIERNSTKCITTVALFLAALFFTPRASAKSLNMGGQSGIFFQLWAEVVPSPQTSSVGL
jgi:hypothetical protein